MKTSIQTTGEAMSKPEPTDKQVADAMRDLESDIRELMHMSDMAANTFDGLGAVTGKSPKRVTYAYTPHELDQFAFLVNNVAVRASLLHKRFDAAWEGRAVL